MRRREFIGLVGGAAAWPLAARAQQPAMPIIGFLHSATPDGNEHLVRAFHQGFGEAGFVEGRNVAIEYRWAENQLDRLPELAADLVRRRVAIIFAQGPAVRPAKLATESIPIVFFVGVDPVQSGYVVSLNRPGGNLTGITSMAEQLEAKRLEFLRELTPDGVALAALINPTNRTGTNSVLPVFQTAARILGRPLHILEARDERDFNAAFAKVEQLRAGGVAIFNEPYFTSRASQLAASALRHKVPAIYVGREFAAAGGLMSYGTDLKEMFRLCGNYVGRILKGEKPVDLPVQQATRIELVINMKTAKALGVTFPTAILVRADEVIE